MTSLGNLAHESNNSSAFWVSWRFVVAVVIGLLGALLVWVTTPYNDNLLTGGFISDSFVPVVAFFVLLVLVLVINPLLRKFLPRLALDYRQLALAMGIMLVASSIPSTGTLRTVMYAVAKVPHQVSQNPRLAEAYEAAGIHPALYPDRIDGAADVPASEYFITELPEGEPVPWMAWVSGPLWSWGLFYVAVWMMMIGLAMIVMPQWRQNERLAFPLLTLQESLMETPADGGAFATVFRRRSFWIAAVSVFVLHYLSGMKQYNPEAVPAISMQWSLKALFADEPLRYLPEYIHSSRIYFVFLGMAFFMPSRIGFSIWFFVIAYGLYIMLGSAYMPPFSRHVVADHRVGGMFALTVAILWLGRAHWKHVIGCMFRGAPDPTHERDRRAGWMFAIGCVGMFAWMVLIGNVQPWWAAFYTGVGFMVCLLITRIVCETGMPFIRITMDYSAPLVAVIGAHLGQAKMMWLLAPASLYFARVMAMVFNMGSRVSVCTMAVHAIGLDRNSSPRHQARLGPMLLGVLVLGLVVCGTVHLYMSYHHSASLLGNQQPVNPWGVSLLDGPNGDLLRLLDYSQSDQTSNPINVTRTNQPDRWDFGVGHLVFGAALAALLYWLCLRSPAWPLHPIGLLMVETHYGNIAWISVMFGWLIKVLILRYGGARLYRQAQPLFLGLIVGEVIAAVFWALEPLIHLVGGEDFIPIWIQPT